MESKLSFKLTRQQFRAIVSAMVSCDIHAVEEQERAIMAQSIMMRLTKRMINRLDGTNSAMTLSISQAEAVAFRVLMQANLSLFNDYQRTLIYEILAKIDQTLC